MNNQERFASDYASLRYIQDNVYKIPPNPQHPKGCPQKAWIKEVAYFQQQLDEFPQEFLDSPKATCLSLFVALSRNAFDNILKNIEKQKAKNKSKEIEPLTA